MSSRRMQMAIAVRALGMPGRAVASAGSMAAAGSRANSNMPSPISALPADSAAQGSVPTMQIRIRISASVQPPGASVAQASQNSPAMMEMARARKAMRRGRMGASVTVLAYAVTKAAWR